MGRRSSAERGSGRLLWRVLILSLISTMAVAGAACGGDDESDGDTETTATMESTETTDGIDDGDTDATDDFASSGDDSADVVDEEAAVEDPLDSLEVLDELPDDYPDLELPPDTELMEARGGEIDMGTGEMTYITIAAYDSQTPAPEQYAHWKEYFAAEGWQFVTDTMFDEPVYTFIMEATNGENSVTVIGGDDDSDFIAEFPDATHPFALVVSPAFMSE